MSKQYTVVVRATSDGKIIKTVKLNQAVNEFTNIDGVSYEIIETNSQKAPQKITSKHTGDNLEIKLDDDSTFTIKDYYQGETKNPIVAVGEDGKYAQFQGASESSNIANIKDSMQAEQLLTPSEEVATSSIKWGYIALGAGILGGIGLSLAKGNSKDGSGYKFVRKEIDKDLSDKLKEDAIRALKEKQKELQDAADKEKDSNTNNDKEADSSTNNDKETTGSTGSTGTTSTDNATDNTTDSADDKANTDSTSGNTNTENTADSGDETNTNTEDKPKDSETGASANTETTTGGDDTTNANTDNTANSDNTETDTGSTADTGNTASTETTDTSSEKPTESTPVTHIAAYLGEPEGSFEPDFGSYHALMGTGKADKFYLGSWDDVIVLNPNIDASTLNDSTKAAEINDSLALNIDLSSKLVTDSDRHAYDNTLSPSEFNDKMNTFLKENVFIDSGKTVHGEFNTIIINDTSNGAVTERYDSDDFAEAKYDLLDTNNFGMNLFDFSYNHFREPNAQKVTGYSVSDKLDYLHTAVVAGNKIMNAPPEGKAAARAELVDKLKGMFDTYEEYSHATSIELHRYELTPDGNGAFNIHIY